MSFILDALKKLEQKRQRGSVPDLMTVHVPEPKAPQRRSTSFYLISAALILNTVVLGIWFFSGKEEEDRALPASLSEQQKTHDPAAPGKKSHEGNQPDHVSSQVIAGPKSQVMKTPADKTASVNEPSVQPARDEGTKRKYPPAPAPKISSQQQPSQRPSVPAKKPAPDATTATGTSSTLKTETAGAVVPPQVPDVSENSRTDQPQGIPELTQLPQSVQTEIPPMSIQGHIYSNSATTRMVNINGSIFREGDMIEKNIRIENITENGVVFNYNGSLFRIRAF